MGQPNWSEATLVVSDGPVLSARQREWLVTMPDDAVVQVLGNDDDGGLAIVCHNGEETNEDVIPWDGQLSQPFVRLIEPEQALDELPTTTTRPTCDEEGCDFPSIVSVREHAETGMPHRCQRHFYEPEGEAA
jgi:hypothetical protein